MLYDYKCRWEAFAGTSAVPQPWNLEPGVKAKFKQCMDLGAQQTQFAAIRDGWEQKPQPVEQEKSTPTPAPAAQDGADDKNEIKKLEKEMKKMQKELKTMQRLSSSPSDNDSSSDSDSDDDAVAITEPPKKKTRQMPSGEKLARENRRNQTCSKSLANCTFYQNHQCCAFRHPDAPKGTTGGWDQLNANTKRYLKEM
jgi:hypothetical protein